MADTSVGADTLAALADAGSSDQLIEVTAPSTTGLTGMRDALLDRLGADAVVPDLLVAGIEDQIGHSARRVGVRRTRSLVSVSSSKQQNGVTTLRHLHAAVSGKPPRNAKNLHWGSQAGMLHQIMLDGSPDLVFLLGADGRFLFVNDTVKRPLGYGKEALLGEHYSPRGLRGRGGGRVGHDQQLHSLAQRDGAVTGLLRRGRRAGGVRRPSSSPGWRKQLRAGLVGLRAAALFGTFAWGAEEVHTVPYVPSAAAEGHAGVVRIESRSSRLGEVRVVAVDDAGQRVEAGRLTLGAGAAVEFEMAALESGDALLGLEGTGPGEGDWRLELSTDLDIEARAYARSEGFVTALHDAALLSGEVELPFFNPGGDARRSVLRLANARGEPAAVSVRGVDDAGRAAGPVTAELGPWEARSYAASELESGSAAGLTGSLGDGDGRWRLTLSADRGSAYATNLLLDGSGVLSSVPGVMSRGGFHRVPLFPSASDGEGRRGLVRVVNRSADSAEVGIDAFDATERAYERLELTLAGEASGQFDSSDLEQGNAEKGLEGSTGPGEGDWWLELSSASDIELVSYVDTASGPLSALRGTSGVETESGMRYEALLWGESGEVRLLNAGGEPAEVRLSGTDDAGSSGGAVELTLAPWSARTLTATALAEGEAGMLGALGAGSGSWRLRLEADREIDVLSLVRGSGGMLSDVSRRGRPAGAPPRTEVIDATARGRPDLWVAASASEAELSPGEAFELTAAVGNVGDRQASATTLRYYRSAGAAITAADAELGTAGVSALAAGDVETDSLGLSAPAQAGTYHYGACVDAVAEETKTANNCSALVAVTVREPPPRPDLAVAATLSDAVLEPGESFTLTATVGNRGGADAPPTTLRYHRSADGTITTTDAQVGTDAVDALAASGTSAESIALTAPTTAGTYYYGACADAVAEETNTSNNCSAAVAVKVTEPPRPPDLVVTAASASEAELSPGEAFDLRATVGNRGGTGASATTLRYYRSADAAITTSDTEVGTDAVAALAAGATSAESLTLNAPTDGGHVLLRGVRGRGGGGDEHLEQLLGGGGGDGSGAAAAAGPGGDGGVGERSGVVARGGVRADGDGGQPGRRCLGDDAALLPLGGRVDHGGGRGGGDGCGGRAGGGGDQRRVTDAERADGAGHVLLRRVRGRGGGGDEHLEQLLGGGGGDGSGAAAAAGPGGDGGVGERSGVVARGGVDGAEPPRADWW